MVREGRGTLGEVQDGLGDPRRSPRRVEGPSVWSGTGQGPMGRFVTGRGTLGEVRYGSEDTRGGP